MRRVLAAMLASGVAAVLLSYRTGTFFAYVAEADWNAGNRSVRCLLWLGQDRTVSRSLKGAGARGLPVL